MKALGTDIKIQPKSIKNYLERNLESDAELAELLEYCDSSVLFDVFGDISEFVQLKQTSQVDEKDRVDIVIERFMKLRAPRSMMHAIFGVSSRQYRLLAERYDVKDSRGYRRRKLNRKAELYLKNYLSERVTSTASLLTCLFQCEDMLFQLSKLNDMPRLAYLNDIWPYVETLWVQYNK